MVCAIFWKACSEMITSGTLGGALCNAKQNKEDVHVQEGRSIRPNEDHEHGNGSNLAEERDYVVLDHIEQIPYQLATDKDCGRYVPILPQQNVRDCKAQTNEVIITSGLISKKLRQCKWCRPTAYCKRRAAAYLSLHRGACEPTCACEMVPQLVHRHHRLGNDDSWFYVFGCLV